MSVSYLFFRYRVAQPLARAESVWSVVLDTGMAVEYANRMRSAQEAAGHEWGWLKAFGGPNPRGMDCHDPVKVLPSVLWLRSLSALESNENREFFNEVESRFWRPDGKHQEYTPKALAALLARDLNELIDNCQTAIQNGDRVLLVCA